MPAKAGIQVLGPGFAATSENPLRLKWLPPAAMSTGPLSGESARGREL
jgi:hypothetical protein